MGAPEILIEHRHRDKVHKVIRIKPDHDFFVIGSSREADLRLPGANVSGCHAVLKQRDGQWFVCDVSGGPEALLGNESLVEARVEKSMAVAIGDHQINIFPKVKELSLFRESEAKGYLTKQQVVVRKGQRILETYLLSAKDYFVYGTGSETIKLPPPLDGKWVTTQVGPRTVQQRLVADQEVVAAENIQIDEGLKRPLKILMVIALLFVAVAVIMPKPEAPKVPADLGLDRKSLEVIYNAKSVKKKMAESKTMTAKMKEGGNTDKPSKGQQAAVVAPDIATGPNADPRAKAALSAIRKGGLSALVGKIAKRANRQGVLVSGTGVTADTVGSGRAIFSTGTSTVGGGGAPSVESNTFRIGGVATKGKAGGASNFKEGTALSGGKVGAGDVAIVDEETEVDGGLDREVIAEVIKRYLGQIRYCYERQLSSDPNLYGKVMVKFSIVASGDVAGPKVENSTLKSAMVEGCILRRLAAWKFPLPKGGTTVNVTYPFLFKAME